MPYTKPTDSPPWVQKKGKAAMAMWMKVFNSAFKEYDGDEKKAFAAAASAVEGKYGKAASERSVFVESFPSTFEGTKVRVQVFPIGHWDGHDDGPLDLTKDDLDTIVKNFEATKRALAVDFNHGIDYGETPEQQRAAGWIRKLEVADDGLYAEFDATDEAAKWIKSGAYRFFSPTFSMDYVNKESGESQGITLLRAALTNSPWFDGMKPAVAMNERTKAVLDKTMQDYASGGVMTVRCPDKKDIAECVAELSADGYVIVSFYRDMMAYQEKLVALKLSKEKEAPESPKEKEDGTVVVNGKATTVALESLVPDLGGPIGALTFKEG